MPAAVIGGNVRYPNLQGIADLFRVQINDTFNGAGGSGTGSGDNSGLIMFNRNPDLLVIMNAAIREVYSDLRNVGDPALILDNFDLIGLPPVNSNLGPGVPNPAAQVSLAYAGYFDGVEWYADWTLPISLAKVLAIWERQSGTGDNFRIMQPARFGLPPCQQGRYNGSWEMRQNAVWMPGATQRVDLRMRLRITFPDFLDPKTINFSTAYIPIIDCGNAVVAKMLIYYAKRFAPEQYQMAIADETRLMDKLKLETVRQMQLTENQRAEFGAEAVTNFAGWWFR